MITKFHTMLNLLNRFFTPNTNPAPLSVLQQASKPQITRLPQMTTPAPTPSLSSITEEDTSGLRKAKLIMVTANNNNKFYEMEEGTDGTFTVSYGRVGSNPTRRSYPMCQWGSKKREKVRKGYKDTTYLFTEKKALVDFLDMDDAKVRSLVNNLMSFAQNSVLDNYNVSSDDVTLQQVEEAQTILDKLSDLINFRMNVKDFNWQLMELYAIIPRKMNNVKQHLISVPSSDEDIALIETKLAEEQATLDVMRGQVEMHEKQQDGKEGAPKTMLEAFGLQIEAVEEKLLIKEIKKMMGNKAPHFHCAYKVINLATQSQFDNHMARTQNPKTELFWHGSRNENWLSILKTGLVLRPANAIINGKMFGYGLYFADKFAKSLNYTSLRGSYWTRGSHNKGFLALYEVHVGNQLEIQKHHPWCGSLSEGNLKKRGRKYNSVFAKGGADLINNEYIIYNQNQCTVRYIIEIR
ncbi:MAG: poly [ADP-ribose] polymerase [Saprospiraceae bacterium]